MPATGTVNTHMGDKTRGLHATRRPSAEKIYTTTICQSTRPVSRCDCAYQSWCYAKVSERGEKLRVLPDSRCSLHGPRSSEQFTRPIDASRTTLGSTIDFNRREKSSPWRTRSLIYILNKITRIIIDVPSIPG